MNDLESLKREVRILRAEVEFLKVCAEINERFEKLLQEGEE